MPRRRGHARKSGDGTEGDRAPTAGQGGQPGAAHADLLGQHPGRRADHGRRPHARHPHPMVPATAGPQRPAADARARRRRRRAANSTSSSRCCRGRPAPVGEIVDRTIAGPGGRLRVRIYRPAGSVARLLPTILYLHGGGWVIGSLEAYDLPCRFFCARSGCAVVAVDYRLAPEHKFPAAARRRRRGVPLARASMRSSSASIRTASSSPAIRPAGRSPPWSRSRCAARRARPACNG